MLNVVRAINKNEFTLQDVYAFAAHLEKLHPANRHVRDKIRQQLQVLRDLGFVEFLGRGRYRQNKGPGVRFFGGGRKNCPLPTAFCLKQVPGDRGRQGAPAGMRAASSNQLIRVVNLR